MNLLNAAEPYAEKWLQWKSGEGDGRRVAALRTQCEELLAQHPWGQSPLSLRDWKLNARVLVHPLSFLGHLWRPEQRSMD